MTEGACPGTDAPLPSKETKPVNTSGGRAGALGVSYSPADGCSAGLSSPRPAMEITPHKN